MNKRILVAEDDPSILLSLQFILTQAGYQVTTAALHLNTTPARAR